MPSSKTILLIENHRDTRFAYHTLLAHYGYHVIEAGDGEEGVTLATRELPDVIIMDLRMPRMNGWEAATVLRQDERTRNIPIVVLTGDQEATKPRPRGKAPFHSWLLKPVEPRALGEHIRGIIGEP